MNRSLEQVEYSVDLLAARVSDLNSSVGALQQIAVNMTHANAKLESQVEKLENENFQKGEDIVKLKTYLNSLQGQLNAMGYK